MTSEIKPPQTPQEALELALTLSATAPDHERMMQAARIAFDIARSMSLEEFAEAMDIIEGRIETRERALFGNTVENLKQH
jgi:hypothetical protein